MNNLVEEIESNLENRNYLSALALTLVLPDICGKIEYPKIGENGKRYELWYNEYIYKYDIPKTEKSTENALIINGRIVYKLRCALLHDGSLDVDKTVRKELNIKDPKKIKFILTNKVTSYHRIWEKGDKSEEPKILIRIGVEDFCRKICGVVKNLYCDKELSQDIFNDVIIMEFD